jgi:hypothetical protein
MEMEYAMRSRQESARQESARKSRDRLPYGLVQYIDDYADTLRDAVVVERNGELRLIRDDETGEELYRFSHELV